MYVCSKINEDGDNEDGWTGGIASIKRQINRMQEKQLVLIKQGNED